MLGKINKNYLLKVKKLSKVFEIRDAALRKRTIKAVDGVSFVINNKETYNRILDIYNNNSDLFDLNFSFKSSGLAIIKKNSNVVV